VGMTSYTVVSLELQFSPVGPGSNPSGINVCPGKFGFLISP
jgi:hypothetical protein